MKEFSSPKFETQLPARYQEFAKSYPTVMQAVEALGEATRGAGPLDQKTCALVKLAIAVGALREGAVQVIRVELCKQAALLRSPRLAFLVPWQQCLGLKIFFEQNLLKTLNERERHERIAR